jgi:thiamine kinase-like enzyme
VHQCLTDYPGALPSYWERIERCASSLRGPKPPAALGAEDRTFLLKTYDRLCEALQRFDVRAAPIHGDAHMGNAFFTPAGPLWTDFETACLGPHEWDVAAISHPAAFSGLDPDLYAILSQLRSLCVVVWCAALAHDPKKRAVGEEQLALLKSAAARRGVGAEVGRS